MLRHNPLHQSEAEAHSAAAVVAAIVQANKRLEDARTINDIREMAIVITVAGMDAALPSVVGGLVPSVVIAVPTSTGYGMARHGETALRAALVSCAPGLLVVNVDNGFGAACAALRTLNAIRRPS